MIFRGVEEKLSLVSEKRGPGGFNADSNIQPPYLGEEPEYASMGKKVRLEEKLLQMVIIIRMIPAGAQKLVSFGSSISSNASQPFARSFLYPW